MLQRLEGECQELEDQMSAARHTMEEQDAAINLAMEDKLTAGEEAQQTLEDLAVFAEEVCHAWWQEGSSRLQHNRHFLLSATNLSACLVEINLPTVRGCRHAVVLLCSAVA